MKHTLIITRARQGSPVSNRNRSRRTIRKKRLESLLLPALVALLVLAAGIAINLV